MDLSFVRRRRAKKTCNTSAEKESGWAVFVVNDEKKCCSFGEVRNLRHPPPRLPVELIYLRVIFTTVVMLFVLCRPLVKIHLEPYYAVFRIIRYCTGRGQKDSRAQTPGY